MLAVSENQIYILPDWTVLVQLLVFFVAMVILNALLFKPVLRLIAVRKEYTAGALQEAGHLNAEADRLDEEHSKMIAAELGKAHAKGERCILDARIVARGTIQEARDASKALLKSQTEITQSSMAKAARELDKLVGELSDEIVSKVVGSH